MPSIANFFFRVRNPVFYSFSFLNHKKLLLTCSIKSPRKSITKDGQFSRGFSHFSTMRRRALVFGVWFGHEFTVKHIRIFIKSNPIWRDNFYLCSFFVIYKHDQPVWVTHFFRLHSRTIKRSAEESVTERVARQKTRFPRSCALYRLLSRSRMPSSARTHMPEIFIIQFSLFFLNNFLT